MRQPLVFSLYCAIIHALKNKNFSGLQTAYEGGFAARKSRQERRCVLELTSIGKKKKIRKKLPHHKMRQLLLWKVQGSNLRPFTRQANALPAELTFHIMIALTCNKVDYSR